MYTKLTLNISQAVVEKAKTTARKRRTSVSKMVEDFLKKVSSIEDSSGSVVQSIIANAPSHTIKAGTEKQIKEKRLKEKYGS